MSGKRLLQAAVPFCDLTGAAKSERNPDDHGGPRAAAVQKKQFQCRQRKGKQLQGRR